MILSGNELVALATKAARGAGAPPEQATTFGRASLCHFQAGRAPQHLRAALEALPTGPILEIPLALTRLMEATEGDVAEGVLYADAPPDFIHSYLEAQPFAITARASQDGFVLTCTLTTPAPRVPPVRVTLPGGLAARMTALAAHLLVPDTAASRASGAGAGLTDND